MRFHVLNLLLILKTYILKVNTINFIDPDWKCAARSVSVDTKKDLYDTICDLSIESIYFWLEHEPRVQVFNSNICIVDYGSVFHWKSNHFQTHSKIFWYDIYQNNIMCRELTLDCLPIFFTVFFFVCRMLHFWFEGFTIFSYK